MEKEQLLEYVKEYVKEHHTVKEYEPGDRISYAGRVYDEEEICNLVDSSLEFWLTAGRYTREFENGLGEYLGIKYVSTVNSGSSANLIAMSALTSPLLGERRIKRGDEVITVAAAFPTTVAPIIQNGAIPVFVDVEIPTYNINTEYLEAALSGRTKAVFVAHSLGNPFDLSTIVKFCKDNNLWLIEDNCDAIGGEYYIDGAWKKIGTIGDIGTSSFYPAHQITMGEGGAVYTDNPLLHKAIRSMRDWGRECICTGGQDNLCGHRFDGQFGLLPAGYDHKYVYSHLGYNLKITDMQAAIGCAQLKKLPSFVEKRRYNWHYLRERLSDLADVIVLPEEREETRPCWFGFMMTIKEGAGKTRNEIVRYLEENKIQTRNFFAGNLLRHPCFENLQDGVDYRVIGEMKETDRIMNNSFWIGVYPGMTEAMLDEMIERIHEALDRI